MADGLVFRVEGLDALEVALRQMPNATAGAVLERAALKGGDVIATEARRRAPRHTGALADRGINVRLARIKEGVRVTIGTTRTFFYAIIIEFGSKAHVVKARGARGKRVLADKVAGIFFGREVQIPALPPRPFLRPALDTKAEEAVEALRQELALECEHIFDATVLHTGGA